MANNSNFHWKLKAALCEEIPGRAWAHRVCLHSGRQGDLHGEQHRLHLVLTGHHLRHRHRGGHREPGLAGDQWLGVRDIGGKHRFGRQQLSTHRRPLRTLPGKHPDHRARPGP
jgi:hypothetical protein